MKDFVRVENSVPLTKMKGALVLQKFCVAEVMCCRGYVSKRLCYNISYNDMTLAE